MVKFKCNICGFESEDAVVFASHILSMHTNVGETAAVETPTNKLVGQLFECELCNAKFRTPEELEDHYYSAHPEEMKAIEEELKKEIEEMEAKRAKKKKAKKRGGESDRGATGKSGGAEEEAQEV